ncbi:hypothetical protein cje77_02607 [Campylobacter jejuni subsp. jejuni 1854]|nr:hypothetical protein cje77_02607 [Campylobacter jejuni subsp. jejuni 1854]
MFFLFNDFIRACFIDLVFNLFYFLLFLFLFFLSFYLFIFCICLIDYQSFLIFNL